MVCALLLAPLHLPLCAQQLPASPALWTGCLLPPQTRLVLPAWLGVADALMAAASSGKRGTLRDMYEVRAAL